MGEDVELENRNRSESTTVLTFNLSPSSISMSKIPRGVWICLGIFLSIGIFLTVLLVSLSFDYVEYNELAFKKDTTRNEVDTSQVYTNGRYFWGLGFAPFTFPRNFVFVEFTAASGGALSIFSSSGLSIQIECSLQYRIIPALLPQLFQTYGVSYDKQIRNVVRSTIKNIAPLYATEDYYQNRKLIGQSFAAQLNNSLYNETFVELGLFQLRKITLSSQITAKLLQTLIQDQTNQQEYYVQNATVIRKQTVTLQQQTLANVTVINATAAAESAYLIQQANTNAFKIKLEARQTALANLFTTLGFNTSQQKLAFVYSTGLGERDPSLQTKVIADLGQNSGVIVNTG